MNNFGCQFNIVQESMELDSLMDQLYSLLSNFRSYGTQFREQKTEEKFHHILERCVPNYKSEIEQIYDDGRGSADTIHDDFQKINSYPQYKILKELLDFLEPDVKAFKNDSERVITTVENIIKDLKFNKWSINEMINIHKNMIKDFNRIISITNTLKESNTYLYQTGKISMQDIDNQYRSQQINFSGNFQQSQFQTGANSTMNINQINNQALQQVCNQVREIISQSEVDEQTKLDLNTDINNFENATTSIERKSAFDSLLSKSASIATIWASLAPYIPEITKYLG